MFLGIASWWPATVLLETAQKCKGIGNDLPTLKNCSEHTQLKKVIVKLLHTV